MIKSPLSKDGKIQYFELFKITVLISFFFTIYSKSFIADSHTVSSMSPLVLTSIMIMFYGQFIFLLLSELKALKTLVKQLMVSIITYQKEYLLLIFKSINNLSSFVNERRLFNYNYKLLCVVRC